MIDREALWGMQVFLAVVEAKTIAAAARTLRVTPSAVSKQLAKLEQRLGTRLLQRTTRSLRVTSAGERYAARATVAVAALAEAEESARAEASAPRGPLRVSAPTVLGQELVAPIAARFLATHREVSMELELSDRFVDLAAEPIDVAIRIARRLRSSGTTARRLGVMGWTLVASPSYLEAHGAPRRPEDLALHRCLEIAHDLERGRWRLERGARHTRVAVSGPLVTTSLFVLRRAVLDGLGIARMPTYVVRAALDAGTLAVVLPTWRLEASTVYALQPSRLFVPSRTRAFVELLVDALPALLASGASADA